MQKEQTTRLADVVAVLLNDIAQARVESDKFSANLSKEYAQNEIMRHFPVPRLDIKNVTVNLKFAFAKIDSSKRDASIVVEAAKLCELGDECISSLQFDLAIRNYMVSDVEGKNFKLIETT